MANKTFALIGNPVSGSKSPEIHENSFKLNGVLATYEAIHVSEKMLGQVVNRLKEEGYGGFNVTIPYKEAVLPFLDELDPLASAMGAVNTVKIESGKLIGYNTDGHGLVSALTRSGVALSCTHILLIGAGGAARGIAHALALAGVKRIHIVNRTLERAEELIRSLREYADLNATASELAAVEGLGLGNFDLVIQTTSVGMTPSEDETPLDPKRFSPETIFCDIVYKPHETRFLREAKASGHQCIYGIDMLVLQALLAEIHWLGDQIDLEKTARQILKQMRP